MPFSSVMRNLRSSSKMGFCAARARKTFKKIYINVHSRGGGGGGGGLVPRQCNISTSQ